MGIPMPMRIPAWAEDHDNATTVRKTHRNKAVFTFMAKSPA
jgi:hypothetical protein